MPVILVRHAERFDYCNRSWVQTAERPWDTSLTKHGHQQSLTAGKAVVEHCKQLGLPPVTRIVSSPLTRCVETSVGIAEAVGVGSLDVDTALAETMCEKWYKSWGFKAISDATWGGPKDFDWASVDVQAPGVARPEVTGPASALHKTLSQLAPLLAGTSLRLNAGYRSSIDHEYTKQYTWGNFESEEALGARMGALVRQLDRDDATIIFVSHGGPCTTSYQYLTGEPAGRCGYTGISVLVKKDDASSAADDTKKPSMYTGLLSSDGSHLVSGDDQGHGTAGRV